MSEVGGYTLLPRLRTSLVGYAQQQSNLDPSSQPHRKAARRRLDLSYLKTVCR